jgi:hypothetical protein
VDRGAAGLCEEASDGASTIVVMASKIENLSQGLAHIKSKFPAVN